MRRLRVRLALIGLPWLVMAAPANAHEVFGVTAAPFWMGALHLVTAPLGIAAIIGLAAAISFAPRETVAWSSILAGITAFAAAMWTTPSVAAAAPIGIIVAGLFAALGFDPARWMGLTLGALGGFAAGSAAQLDVRAISGALGVAVVVMSATLWAVEAFAYGRTVLPLARRVIGAWVAAIALLLGALAIKLSLAPR
jgi:hypothetical protein